MDNYSEIYKICPRDNWINEAFDESGCNVCCDICGANLLHDPIKDIYFCQNCNTELYRLEFFDRIGAKPPGKHCAIDCRENYPLCRKWCLEYSIKSNAPKKLR